MQEEAMPTQPEGFGGWLAFYAIAGGLGAFSNLMRMADDLRATGEILALWPLSASYVLATVFLLWGSAVIAMAVVFGSYMIFAHWSTTRVYHIRLWRSVFWFAVVALPLTFVGGADLAGALVRLGDPTAYAVKDAYLTAVGACLGAIIAAGLWWGYWTKSRRVRQTFPTGMDRPAAPNTDAAT